MWAVYLTACCLTLWLYNRAFIIAQLSTTPQTNSHIRLIKSSIEMCLWKERRYSMQKTVLQTIHCPLFSQRGLLSLQPRLCLCLLAYTCVNLFPTDFLILFHPFAELFLHCCKLTVNKRTRLYKQLKYSRHPGLHTWQCAGILED